MPSAFARILRAALNDIPGAIGGAFADGTGETVDAVSSQNPYDWAVLTAHYGVVLSQVQDALRTLHYGEAQILYLSHAELDVIIRAVREGYYALVAIRPPAALGQAMEVLSRTAAELDREMG
jgi:hypothetical protein